MKSGYPLTFKELLLDEMKRTVAIRLTVFRQRQGEEQKAMLVTSVIGDAS